MNETKSAVSTDKVLRLVADRRRRRLIQFLREADDTRVSVEDLAVQLTEGGASGGRKRRKAVERTETELYHTHLPKLAALDVIAWDRDRGVVASGPELETVASTLSVLHRHADELPAGDL